MLLVAQASGTGQKASMTEDSDDTGPRTAEELRAHTRRDNRNILLILLAVGGLFLFGAFGVAFLVVYGPY